MFTQKKGFTLIELMLVVIIIGILVSMVVPRLVGRSEQARIAASLADINANIATALDMYELDNGQFPSTEQGLQALVTKPDFVPVPAHWNGPYLKKIPLDPWQRPYEYKVPSSHNQDYDLYSLGPDGIESADDISNWHSENPSE
jgi:general secretion pathway protein G